MATSGSSSCILCACLLVGFVAVANGSAFRTPTPILEQMRAEDMRAAMLDELMSGLGGGSSVTKDRLANLEEAMRPIFLSLPKNTDGNLDHATVRYLLHRIFVLRHGMFIKGLHPGEEVNASSATMVLADRVPTYVQALFEDRLQGQGLGVHEVSMLAATLEHLIHDENSKRLQSAYEAYRLSLDDHVSDGVAEDLVKLYMIFFFQGQDFVNDLTSRKAKDKRQRIDVKKLISTKGRNALTSRGMKFASEVLKEVVEKSGSNPLHLPFTVVASAIEEIGERYGRWEDLECLDMKSTMLSWEKAGPGRVALKDFYTHGAPYSESKAYLQAGGMLDESDPARPTVIISNYINAHTNCVGSSAMYSACCINECEGLFGHLEREVAEPEASPDRILELVANLPSATVQAPRVLPETLRSRLHEIAIHHGAGRVPLHGRLFTQWMHHAYPSECPFPHMPGTIITEKISTVTQTATQEERMFYMDASSSPTAEAAVANEEISMWSTEEQLVAVNKAATIASARHYLRTIAFLVVVVSTCVSLLRTAASAFGDAGKKSVLPFASKSHFC